MPYDHYRAPPRDMCDFFLATLPSLTEQEEHESLDLARRLQDIWEGPKRDFHTNRIMDHFPWLAQAGLITSRFFYANKGGNRLLIRRADNIHAIKNRLIDAEDIYNSGDHAPTPGRDNRRPKSASQPTKTSAPQHGIQPDQVNALPQAATEDKPRRKKKKKTSRRHEEQPTSDSAPEKNKSKRKPTELSQPLDRGVPRKKKKKKRCCDEPRIVRSKKTGKRRCKNCGKKFKPRTPKND